MSKSEEIYQPSHYTDGPLETIEIIEEIVRGLRGEDAYCLGNVLKYALRAGKKGDAGKDLAKAANYAYRLCTGRWRQQ